METQKPKGNPLKFVSAVAGTILLGLSLATAGQAGSLLEFIVGLVLLVLGAAEEPLKKEVKTADSVKTKPVETAGHETAEPTAS